MPATPETDAELVDDHPGEDHEGLRVVFWNTWLLAPRLWPTGPRVPGGTKMFFAPDVELRSPMIGPAMHGRFDVAALAEVFERSEQDAVTRSWPDAAIVQGPQRRRFKPTGSGLVTLVDRSRATIVRTAKHAYRSGGDLRDSDTFATKGALMTCVRPTTPDGSPMPDVEIVSTHLLAGGDLFPVPGANDQARHHAARMRQVDELGAWVQEQHRP